MGWSDAYSAGRLSPATFGWEGGTFSRSTETEIQPEFVQGTGVWDGRKVGKKGKSALGPPKKIDKVKEQWGYFEMKTLVLLCRGGQGEINTWFWGNSKHRANRCCRSERCLKKKKARSAIG